jgi:carbonic anhydrase
MNPLERLLSGNARFVTQKTVATNPPELLAELSTSQTPFAAILCCADSRVAPEIVFDQQLGNLFVCRIAGNVPTSEIIESLEYAVGFLGVQLIVVMGHSSCGAVTAALESEFAEGLFSQIALSPIPDLNESISHNAKQGAKTILDCSPLILDAIESGDLAVTSGVQDIASGKFTVLDCYQAHEH